ncbi:hypothetical protein BDA99DRAFT_518764 [Phascolomyces articulosus]|uniref:Rad4-domain-containing protein n=1 Tax=Phascolomyces articulosus TaxID=60185 RepID=A0AAD5K4Y6_9FUNG|nr:hypothetical protein BDA99DRAFT_518764 [Phascolomyces articulosus]
MAKRGTKRLNDNEEQPTKRRITRSTKKIESTAESSTQSRQSSSKQQKRDIPAKDNDDRRSSNDSNSDRKQRARNQTTSLTEQFIQAEENDANGLEIESPLPSPVLPVIAINDQEQENDDNDDDDNSDMGDNMDWEDIQVPHTSTALVEDGPMDIQQESQYKDVEIVFEAPRAVLKKSKWQAEYDRTLREAIHHTHVVSLIAHFMIRNGWCASNEVQAVCLSVVPDYLQTQCDRKDLSEKDFEKSIKWLMTWWKGYFTLTGAGLGTRAYDEYEFFKDFDFTKDDNLALDILKKRDMVDGENIQTAMDFVDKLVSKEGFRDISAELFVAILRALSFDARLVCSLQPVPYRIPAAKKSDSPRPADTEDMIGESSTSKPRFPIRVRGPKLEDDSTLDKELKQSNAKPPTIWAEVYNQFTEKWVCIDPIRGHYNQRKAMQPGNGDRHNVMSIVLAFSPDQDGCIDVTRRYSSNMTKALRLREKELTKREKEGGFKSWWEGLYTMIQRKRWSRREEQEQDELENLNTREPIPTSIGAFNNHPLYALERHLKKFEVLYPKEPILGHIRGEVIYPRSCVKTAHTAETWIKQGRVIKDGEQPIKYVNARAVTLEKKRILEMAKQEGETIKTPCYGKWQTDVYKPPPVVDGIVPKNAFGKVDLYTPEMLPAGAAHIPINGIAKIARKLGINYAEATVDFEFARGRSIPVTSGIVVAKENKHILLEAWSEHEHTESTKAIKKQEKEVYGRWRKLILGTLIKARLDREYGGGDTSSSSSIITSSAITDNESKSITSDHKDTPWESFLKNRHKDQSGEEIIGGGFIPQEDSPDAGGFFPDD